MLNPIPFLNALFVRSMKWQRFWKFQSKANERRVWEKLRKPVIYEHIIETFLPVESKWAKAKKRREIVKRTKTEHRKRAIPWDAFFICAKEGKKEDKEKNEEKERVRENEKLLIRLSIQVHSSIDLLHYYAIFVQNMVDLSTSTTPNAFRNSHTFIHTVENMLFKMLKPHTHTHKHRHTHNRTKNRIYLKL